MSTRTGMLAAAASLLMAAGANANGDEYEYRADDMTPAPWHEGFYVSGLLGAAFGEAEFEDTVEVDLEKGILIGLTLGYDHLFPGPWGDFRLEAEISYRTHDFTGGPGDEISLTALMGNLWYDFGTNGPIVPYAGMGFGIGFLDEAADEAGFAFQFGGGVNYHMTWKLTLGLNYRYLMSDFEQDDAPGTPEIDYTAHQISLSLAWKF